MTYNEICMALAGAQIENNRGEASMLICHFCGINQADLLLSSRDDDFDCPELENAVRKRCQHYPLQYILGYWEFCHETYRVTEDTLIPRQDTEKLVELAIKLIKADKAKKVIAKVKKTSFLGMVGELGIASVVSPKEIIANQIISYLRAISNDRGSNVITLYKLVDNKVEALEFVARKKEKFYNKPLKELKTKENCLIACIIREGQVIIPGGNDFIQQNDSVIVVTTHEQFDDLSDAFE